VTAPAHAPGAVDVRVSSPAGTSAVTASVRYTYEPTADLRTVIQSPGQVALGDASTVTVTVTNRGPDPTRSATTVALAGAGAARWLR
jgi:hypothetical protein